MPPALADQVVASDLAQWLSVPERQALAQASQHAAVAERGSRIAWVSKAPGGGTTAAGWTMPVSDVYRSVRGEICRDVSQTIARDDAPLAQSVSLCRGTQGADASLWRQPSWP